MATAELKFNGTTIITETAGVANLQNINDINPSNLKFNTTNHEFTIKGADAPIVGANYSTNDDPNSGQLAIYNGATKLWGITEGGYVVNPNVPTFTAYAGQNTTGPTYAMIFTSTIHNNGNHYSTSTGKFTAPIDGYYCFLCRYLSNTGSSVQPRMSLNDAWVTGATSYTDSTGYNPGSISVVLYCSAGDSVGFGIFNGGEVHLVANYNSGFSGYLIG